MTGKEAEPLQLHALLETVLADDSIELDNGGSLCLKLVDTG